MESLGVQVSYFHCSSNEESNEVIVASAHSTRNGVGSAIQQDGGWG